AAAEDRLADLEVLVRDRQLADRTAARLGRRDQVDLVELHLPAAGAARTVRAHGVSLAPTRARYQTAAARGGGARSESHSAWTSGEASFLRCVQTPTRNSPSAS